MRTILVCNNVDCAERGSREVYERLCALVDERQLPDVEVREYLCFSACEKGPNVVCVEDRVWYCGVRRGDVSAIVDGHLIDGRPAEHLRPRGDSLTENVIFSTLEAGLLPGDAF